MCGLLFTNHPGIDPGAFAKALALMDHRGPDAAGCTTAVGHAQLGHNRLAILDLDPRSNQPFRSSDGRYLVVYNGEIYNFRELAQRHRLELRTSGDTEVLLELYIRFGPKMLTELNGMFAFVILDTETGRVFAARDRLGIKPLYHLAADGRHTFASEVAAVVHLHPGLSVDEFAVRQYLKLRTFFNSRTLYAGVKMFPAGCYLEDGTIHRYWSLPEGPQAPPTDEELRELVESAVRYRRISDVSVGSYLSGGLDSTIVAALADRPHTWTVGTRDNNEFEWARLAAERLGTTHHEVVITSQEFLEAAHDLITVRREPLSVPNEVSLYLMTRAVKEHNTVILSGEGADELFFGYDRIFNWAAAQRGELDLEGFDRHYSYGKHEDRAVIEDALAPFAERSSPLDVVAAFFQVAHLHGLLRRLDNSTMRCSVEGRVPFVDHRLVERMAGVAFDYRSEGGVPKAPLKRVFSDVVPAEIINRQKVGFPVDLAAVFADAAQPSSTPMDAWLRFNLNVLGVETDV